ncbi:MAG TPA: dihydroorotate dehydrogenase electron transfer subunit [Papillibacter sp.]|nr:dihydroorotate dehydrogenase electron transfer subunit [Papillibacter sp.]
MPITTLATVQDTRMLTESVCKMVLFSPELARLAKPGQFVHIKCGGESLLRRPISICDVQEDTLTLVLERKGAGTQYLAERRAGDTLDLLGPLGNGFELPDGKLLLVGGGIGVPPLLYAAKRAKGADAVLGFKTKSAIILEEEFQSACGETAVVTDDGSYRLHGNVTVPLREMLHRGGYAGVLACGPRAMLRAVAEVCAAFKVPCQVSMEERMGCGVGACLVCVCETEKEGERAMSRVCKDGPVFRAEEVCW